MVTHPGSKQWSVFRCGSFLSRRKVGGEGEQCYRLLSSRLGLFTGTDVADEKRVGVNKCLNPGPREHTPAIRNPSSRGNLSLTVFIAADTFPLQIWSLNTPDTCYHTPKSLFKIPFLKRHVLNAYSFCEIQSLSKHL